MSKRSGNTRSFYEQFQTTSKFIKPEAKGSSGSAAPAPAPAPAPTPAPAPVSAPAPFTGAAQPKQKPPAFSGVSGTSHSNKPPPKPDNKKPDAGANYSFPTLRNCLPSQAGKRAFFEQGVPAAGKPSAPSKAPAAAPSSSSGSEKSSEEMDKLLQQLMEEEEALEKEVIELHELLKASLDETDELVAQLQESDDKLQKNKKLLKEILDLAKKMIAAKGDEKAALEKKFASTYLRTSSKK
eukprot:TRINITY_DN1434_c0_g1_i1.p1 TRINITY_DN1434_c0_g1~~TRINITY_DN1434_c0_g1_i1.p1  ORF type:complete len:239 (-),score=94.40 TRINITY_DN1434_c0_g1_i1:186-902(-)